MRRVASHITVVLALALLMSACSGSHPWRLEPAPDYPIDQQPLTELPEERDPSLFWDAINQSSFYLVESSFDLPRQYRKLTGQLKEAYNADVFGEVPDGSWFTNRHGQTPMTPEEIRCGPNTISGPDTTGPWMITRAKTEGVTPGFFVQDPAGEIFVLKFDPVAYPELATGAEMVSTKFFYALGYNVPENYLVTFDPSRLTIKKGITFSDRYGHKQPFTRDVLDDVLSRVARNDDGQVRAIASRFLPGRPIGPFSYHGRRKDDPNDYIPHQHRRELRGLKVFAQLVNHFDTKDHNTLDILVNEDGKTYVRHYLIDFGSTLGSDGDEPKPVYKGYAYVFDLEQAVVSLATLGVRQWSWEGANPHGIPISIGYFESELFHPPGWKPLHANPAFDNMTHLDAFWAASILGRFEEEHLRACVEAAEYSDPAATEYLIRTLLERRRKILEYYYSKVNPLGDFALHADGDNLRLQFTDRWIADGLASAETVRYRYRSGHQEDGWGDYLDVGGSPTVTVGSEDLARMRRIAADAESEDRRVFHVELQSNRDSGGWGRWVRVYFYFDPAGDGTRIVGIERED